MVGAVSLYQILKPTNYSKVGNKKEEMQTIRNKILEDKHTRMLYSTMTFFYLHGF